MKVEQVYTILSDIVEEILGETIIVNEDLSNVVDIGKAFSNLTNGLDNYVRTLQDRIGRTVFVERVYDGRVPSVVRDGWEWGSILMKVRTDLLDAEENESWNLTDHTSYDPNIFRSPVIHTKFYNDRVTFEIPISITEIQVKESFNSATQMNAFYSMIQTAIQNSITVQLDSLIMRTINTAIAETVHADYPSASYSNGSGVKAVNLLYLYNQTVDTPISVDDALHNLDFIKFASYKMSLYSDRLAVISTLFNTEGAEKFTPKALQHFVLLAEFKRAADVYLQSDTFNEEFTRLPEAETVPYWQGSGIDYSFSATSNINIITPNNHTVNIDGVLGIMFDRDALGVANLDRRVTTNYNPKAEFWNEWHKVDCGLWVDGAENCVVFFIA